jgi:hypothetical protein
MEGETIENKGRRKRQHKIVKIFFSIFKKMKLTIINHVSACNISQGKKRENNYENTY